MFVFFLFFRVFAYSFVVIYCTYVVSVLFTECLVLLTAWYFVVLVYTQYDTSAFCDAATPFDAP